MKNLITGTIHEEESRFKDNITIIVTIPNKNEAIYFFKDSKFRRGRNLLGDLYQITYVEFKLDIDKLEQYADKARERFLKDK